MKGKLLGGTAVLFLLTGMAIAAPGGPDRKSPGLSTRFETLSAVKDSTAGVVGRLAAELVRSRHQRHV
jgi:hypothetical protein